MLALLLAPEAAAQVRMSAERFADIAARTPTVFDVFFEREADDLARRPRFRVMMDGAGASVRMPLEMADVPASVAGARVTLGGVVVTTADRGWRIGGDVVLATLTPDEDALEQVAGQLSSPEDAEAVLALDEVWSYSTNLAYGGWFDTARGLSFTAGPLYRYTPVVETVDGRTVFTTTPVDGVAESSVYTTGAFGHASWAPAGEVALTVEDGGIGQVLYRRPFEPPRVERAGPLWGTVPRIGLMRLGGFVEGYALVPRWVTVDASLAGQWQGGARLDHASLAIESVLREDADPPDPDFRERDTADLDLGIVLRARGSAWQLQTGLAAGGAAELAVTGIRIGRKGSLDVAVGGAYNDYRALTLLPLSDVPLTTFRLDYGL